MNIVKAQEAVRRFQLAFNHPVSDQPKLVTIARQETRLNWLLEEINEFRAASTLKDVADALGDIIYIALGTAIENGVKLERIYNQLCEKDYEPRAGKLAMLPTEYQETRWATLETYARDIMLCTRPDEVEECLAEIVFLCVHTANEYGMDIEPVFYIIQDANMSKLGPDGKPIYKEDNKIAKPEGWQPPEPKIEAELERQRLGA